jgi:apoptotic chromatin condensation inducer in the nucleus
MSSPYPVLGNRSIDQWKVTELKEELKRRKLTTKGLKDDLIRRLDEALRVEMENAKQDVDNGVGFGSKPVVGEKDAQTVPVAAATAKGLANSGGNKNKNKNTDSVMVQVDINDSAAAFDQGKVEEGDILGGTAARVEELLVVHSTNVETSIKVTETVTSEVALSEHNLENMNIETQKENGNSKSLMENEDLKPQLENEDSMPQLENEDPKPQLEDEDSKPQLENEDSKPQLESEDSKPQLENEGLKPPPEGVMLDSSTPENQVSEVSPILGSQVKSDSISTDSVSINEKIELKDNVIADHVKLELDVVNPEMVEPSSSNVVPVGGESHPMDVEVPHENKESDGGKDDNSATDADISKKIDSADLGYSEKLNLDRSSGDDSMEEDVLESRQIDSKYNSEEVENRSEKSEVPVVKEESHVAILGDAISAEKKDVHVENENRPAALAEKRKLNGKCLIMRIVLILNFFNFCFYLFLAFVNFRIF